MEISMTASSQKKIWKLSSLEEEAAALLGFVTLTMLHILLVYMHSFSSPYNNI
jgi:hypothetical protein